MTQSVRYVGIDLLGQQKNQNMKLDLLVVLVPPPVEGEELADRRGTVSILLLTANLDCEAGQNPKKANRNHSILKRAKFLYSFSGITMMHYMYLSYVSETVMMS